MRGQISRNIGELIRFILCCSVCGFCCWSIKWFIAFGFTSFIFGTGTLVSVLSPPDSGASFYVDLEDLHILEKNHLLREEDIERIWDYFSSSSRSTFFGGDVVSRKPPLVQDSLTGLIWAGLESILPTQFWSEVGSYFSVANVLYLLGALIVAASLSFFMTKGWEIFGGYGISALSILYCVLFLFVGNKLYYAGKLVPASLFYMMAISTAPLATYGIQKELIRGKSGNEFFFLTHSKQSNRFWIPMELATAGASVASLMVFPSPFLALPGWIAIALATRDFPEIFQSVSKPGRAKISLGFSYTILAVARFFEVSGFIPNSVDLGITFLPNSPIWGYIFGIPAVAYSFSLMNNTHTRKNQHPVSTLMAILTFLAVITHLLPKNTHIIPGTLAGLCLVGLSVTIPDFILNQSVFKPTLYIILLIDGAVAIILPGYVRFILPGYLADYFVTFHSWVLFCGLGFIGSGFLLLTSENYHPTTIWVMCQTFINFIFFLLTREFRLGMIIPVFFLNGMTTLIHGGLVLGGGTIVTLLDPPFRYAMVYLVLAVATLGLTEVLHNGLIPPLNLKMDNVHEVGYILSLTVGIVSSAIFDHTLRYIHRGFPVLTEIAVVVSATLAVVRLEYPHAAYPLWFAVWALCGDLPQLFLTGDIRGTRRSLIISAVTSMVFGVCAVMWVYGTLIETDKGVQGTLKKASAEVLWIGGYVAIWGGYGVLVWFFRRNLAVIGFYALLNLVSLNIPEFRQFGNLNLVSFVGFSLLLDQQNNPLASFLNLLFGLLSTLTSIVLIYFKVKEPLPILVEVVGIVGFATGISFFSRQTSKTAIVASYAVGYVCFLLSSFRTPSNGNLLLLVGLAGMINSMNIVQIRRTAFTGVPSKPIMVILARVGVILSSCLMLLVGPSLENIFLFYIAILLLLYCFTNLLSQLSLNSIITSLVMSVPIILVGVSIQSKLVVILGYIFIFIAINALAVTVFPKSVMFPFVLTFCGVAFIYAGLSVEQEGLSSFHVNQFTSQGNVEAWTESAIKMFF